MQLLNSLAKFGAQILSLGDGEIWAKTSLKLNILEIRDEEKRKGDIQMDNRAHTLPKRGNEKAYAHKDSEQMRFNTPAVSKGTVYGIPQKIETAFNQHSMFGMNKACLNTDGVPSYATIVKHLRETSVSVDLREQRLNLYFDTMISPCFYDNATALLFCFYQKLALMEIIAKMKTYKHTIKLGLEGIVALYNMGDEQSAISHLTEMLMRGPYATGVGKGDRGLYDILKKIKTWYESLGEQITSSPERLAAAVAKGYSFEMTVDVWHMYKYDDGHNRSEDHFGDHFGFRKGRFMVPSMMFTILRGEMNLFDQADTLVPDTDRAILDLKRYSGTVQLTGFTGKEVRILSHIMQGNTRNTPFLVDQDVDLKTKGKRYRGLYMPDIIGGNVVYDAEELQEVLHKFISNHRLYEDALTAKESLKYWVAQPGTETLESHWWTHLERTLTLPNMALQRASVPVLLTGEAIATTADALESHGPSGATYQSYLFYSMFCNTAWYWGEYFTVHNTVNTDRLIRNMRYPDQGHLDHRTRADAMLSAVTGKPVRQPLYREMSTWITGGIRSQFKNRVRIGFIDLPHMVSYGYRREGDTLMYDKMVTPSGIALITGLAGTLLTGTPYNNIFATNPTVTVTEYGVEYQAANYNDLCALGVLARWNGHDLHYEHPKYDTPHKIYAANDVSIAVPPVPPLNMKAAASYKILQVLPRKWVFGSSHSWAYTKSMVLTWDRTESIALREPSYTAPPCAVTELAPQIKRNLVTAPVQVDTYMGMITAEYDYVESVFRIAQTHAGVAMPGQLREYDALATIEEEIPPELEQPPQPGPT